MSLSPVVRQILAGLSAEELVHRPDAELLARFIADREEAAFAVLVERHGPAVLGVCRRMLGHVQDTEDAAQAVFLDPGPERPAGAEARGARRVAARRRGAGVAEGALAAAKDRSRCRRSMPAAKSARGRDVGRCPPRDRRSARGAARIAPRATRIVLPRRTDSRRGRESARRPARHLPRAARAGPRKARGPRLPSRLPARGRVARGAARIAGDRRARMGQQTASLACGFSLFLPIDLLHHSPRSFPREIVPYWSHVLASWCVPADWPSGCSLCGSNPRNPESRRPR